MNLDRMDEERTGEQGLGTEAVRGPATFPWSWMHPWVSLAPREEGEKTSGPTTQLKNFRILWFFKVFSGAEAKVYRNWNPSSLSPWRLIVGFAIIVKVLLL